MNVAFISSPEHHCTNGLVLVQVAGCAPGLLRLKGCGSTAGLGQLVVPVPIQATLLPCRSLDFGAQLLRDTDVQDSTPLFPYPYPERHSTAFPNKAPFPNKVT